mmetsp:Transcript_30437/g.65583  ORF Transcript_30437/g.65583 Transcript_30437/m.65583 type:complete len:330 (+) Transcript_30437:151-1140(+)
MSNCIVCDAQANHSCGKCRSANYCSPTCQRGHWKVHKKTCGMTAEQVAELAVVQASLPCYFLEETYSKTMNGSYLALCYRNEGVGVQWSTLLEMGLVKRETRDRSFICNVLVCDERGKEQAVVDIHREALMLLCGEEAAGMVDSLGRINQAAFACTGGLQNPLAPQLHRQRSPKTLQEKQVEALSKLPAYRLKHICITTDGGGGFLTLVTNRTIEAGTITPTGATLTSIQLVQQETDDEMFVCGVSVFNEGLYQETGSDEAVVDVHREALRLLTGEEGVKVTFNLLGGYDCALPKPANACSRVVRRLIESRGSSSCGNSKMKFNLTHIA